MRYVLVMLGSLVGLVIVAYLLLYLLISVGCIYPANYAEQKINEAYDTILRADKVTAQMIEYKPSHFGSLESSMNGFLPSSSKVRKRIREIFL